MTPHVSPAMTPDLSQSPQDQIVSSELLVDNKCFSNTWPGWRIT